MSLVFFFKKCMRDLTVKGAGYLSSRAGATAGDVQRTELGAVLIGLARAAVDSFTGTFW